MPRRHGDDDEKTIERDDEPPAIFASAEAAVRQAQNALADFTVLVPHPDRPVEHLFLATRSLCAAFECMLADLRRAYKARDPW